MPFLKSLMCMLFWVILISEMVAQGRAVCIQTRAADGQGSAVDGQERTVDGQEHSADGQERSAYGLGRSVVAIFYLEILTLYNPQNSTLGQNPNSGYREGAVDGESLYLSLNMDVIPRHNILCQHTTLQNTRRQYTPLHHTPGEYTFLQKTPKEPHYSPLHNTPRVCILFHNTPGQYTPLQNTHKQYSSLHSTSRQHSPRKMSFCEQNNAIYVVSECFTSLKNLILIVSISNLK